jgi:hypothetical protein
MRQTHDEITQNLAERLCWQVARRDAARLARRLYRKPLVAGVYRWDEGAVLDAFCHFLDHVGGKALLAEVRGTPIPRERRPFVQDVWRYGLKTLFGLERIQALPALLFSDEALMPWVGLNAQQVRDGVCQRGTTTRQGERALGPIGPDTLAQNSVQGDLRPLAAGFNGASRALGQASVVGQQVTGMAAGPEVETTGREAGGGQATRQRRIEDTRGQGHEIAVTVYGWTVLRWMATQIPLAVQGGPLQAHEPHWPRALVTQARAHLAGAARLHPVVVDQGFVDGTDLWWLDQQEMRFVVPAKANLAVTADARAPAAVGAGLTRGRRVHTVRHGQGQAAYPARLATEVVGLTALITDDQDGTPEHGRAHHRRDFQAHPIHAVVVRQWNGRESGPGGTPVFLTTASVAKPVQPVDDDDDRRLIENCGI